MMSAVGTLCQRIFKKWHSLVSSVFSGSMFAPISRQEAELIQQQAPPSYGQLIAQGIIPPVEDFPTENPNEVRAQSATGVFKPETQR